MMHMKNGIYSIFKMLGILVLAYLVIAFPALVYTGDITLPTFPERNSQDTQIPFKEIQETDSSENTNTSINQKPVAVEYYNRTFEWEYEGHPQNYTIEIPKELYDYYKSQPHSSQRFSRYARTDKDRELLNGIIDDFEAYGEKCNYDGSENAMNIIAFVQAIPYTSDKLTTGYEEYPRYPVETLVDNGGDCEDSVILAAALLSEMGYGTVLLEFPSHLALGVKGSDGFSKNGDPYLYKGEKYYYVETTISGYEIGEIPDDVNTSTVIIHPMEW